MTEFMPGVAWAILKALMWIGYRLLWFLWPVWFVLAVVSFLGLTARPAEAGWFSWIWGDGSSKRLERSAELAQEAARVAAQAAEAQAEQAAAQADQNSRVAEVLNQLSVERQHFVENLKQLAEYTLHDSQLAAVLNASGPILISLVVLTVAGLALWMVTRAGRADHAELIDAMDLLVEDMAKASQVRRDPVAGRLLSGPRQARLPVYATGYRDQQPEEDANPEGTPQDDELNDEDPPF